AEQLKMEAAAALSKLPGVRMIPLSPPPLPGSEGFPVEFIVGSTGEPAQIAELAGQLVRKAYSCGLFMYADTDVKFDQPQTEVVFLENEAKGTLPQGYSVDYAGESRQRRTEGKKFLGVFVLSAILIYLVLAAQFESFRDPFIILAGSVPLALSGALLFSFLGLTTLNIYSQVGLITLVGLVSKNGILIVEFANKLQEHGKNPLSAI